MVVPVGAQYAAAIGGRGFYPTDFGTSLVALWDAERADKLTLSGANVTTWTDIVAGYAPTQAVTASKPTYSATGLNGRSVVTYDGSDDILLLASVPFPTGANPCEMWALVNQAALVADTGTRTLATYGGVTGGTRRSLNRIVSSGVNRARVEVGNGTSGITAVDTTVDFSGIHVLRGQATGADAIMQVDGGATTSSASIPGTTTTQFTLGAGNLAAFFNGGINCFIVTLPLTAGQAAQLTAFLKARGGIS